MKEETHVSRITSGPFTFIYIDKTKSVKNALLSVLTSSTNKGSSNFRARTYLRRGSVEVHLPLNRIMKAGGLAP